VVDRVSSESHQHISELSDCRIVDAEVKQWFKADFL